MKRAIATAPGEPTKRKSFTKKQKTDFEKDIAKQKAEKERIAYKYQRQEKYKNGDYIDALMHEMNHRRLNGEAMTQPMDDALGHWLSVKDEFPKPKTKK